MLQRYRTVIQALAMTPPAPFLRKDSEILTTMVARLTLGSTVFV
jgi:hypothetical protein